MDWNDISFFGTCQDHEIATQNLLSCSYEKILARQKEKDKKYYRRKMLKIQISILLDPAC